MKRVRKSIVYQRCEDFASILVNLGYSVVTMRDLEYLLKRHVGADPRTVRAYKRHLVEFNFLQTKGNYFVIWRDWIPVQKTLEALKESRS